MTTSKSKKMRTLIWASTLINSALLVGLIAVAARDGVRATMWVSVVGLIVGMAGIAISVIMRLLSDETLSRLSEDPFRKTRSFARNN